MRKIIVTEFISLDGVIEDPGGSEKSKHGAWTFQFWSDDIGQYKGEELFACDAQLRQTSRTRSGKGEETRRCGS